jgi:hypothetical protein
MRDLQKKELLDALSLVAGPAHPGEIIEREYPREGMSEA